jgi:hypothetical protein
MSLKLLASLLALVVLLGAAAAPAIDDNARIQYSWSKSGFVVLRKEMSISRSGAYQVAYNGRERCSEKGVLPASSNAALWEEIQAVVSLKDVEAPQHRSAAGTSRISTPAAMDNGPTVETLALVRGDDSWTFLDTRAPSVRRLMDRIRQMLPPCAF